MSTGSTLAPPLILGAGGRLGLAFRRLWAAGLWPRPVEPLWHLRRDDGLPGAVIWDLDGPEPDDPRLTQARGVIVLAGATSGDAAALAANSAAARAAMALPVAGPRLLLSSAAVYGRAAGPLTEEMAPTPAAPYGAAKAAMEEEAADWPGATCLRLANVAGSDALFGAMAQGPVRLDAWPDGATPRRSYIGPLTLARCLLALLDRKTPLPRIVNLASPGVVAMADVLRAAGADWRSQPAPPTAIAEVSLQTDRLEALLPFALPTARAADLVAEARAAGWRRGDESP